MSERPEPLLPIGELSRASGLSVSALRFYDRAGVLAPADVEPWSGHRRYSPAQVGQARMLAGMRRVQMPVAEMAAALDALRDGDHAAVGDLLTAHLARLEAGLLDARRQLADLHLLLGSSDLPAPTALPDPPTAGLPAATLRGLLEAVRPAVGTDPEVPVLMGVLVEVAEEVTLVGTDRYRMVVAGPWRRTGPPGRGGSAVLPTPEVDRLVGWLVGREGRLEVNVEGTDLVVTDGGESLRLAGTDEPYPDYRRVLALDDELAPLDAGTLREALDTAGPLVELGGLHVDRAYLWDAVRSVPDGQVLLPVGGVIAPLVVRSPEEDDVVALVMPVRPEAS